MTREAIKIFVAGQAFLLPATHSDYVFPNYIREHVEAIAQHVIATDALDVQLPDLGDFKRKTGIIGWPLSLHDVDLYIADRKIDVKLVLQIDETVK